MTHAGGRPTKYEERFVDEVDVYLSMCGREQTALPTLEGFALHLDISMDALEDYRKLYPEFSGALKRITLNQKQQLINDGIYGGKEVNSTIVKLLLQNNHGMRDKVDQDIKSDGKEIKGFNYLPPAQPIEDGTDNSDNKTNI